MALNQMGATWAEISPQLINLLLLAAVYIAVAWWGCRRRAEGPRGFGVFSGAERRALPVSVVMNVPWSEKETSRQAPAPRTRRHALEPPEDLREVALVNESASQCDLD